MFKYRKRQTTATKGNSHSWESLKIFHFFLKKVNSLTDLTANCNLITHTRCSFLLLLSVENNSTNFFMKAFFIAKLFKKYIHKSDSRISSRTRRNKIKIPSSLLFLFNSFHLTSSLFTHFFAVKWQITDDEDS